MAGSKSATLVAANWVVPALSTTAVNDPPTTTLPLGRGRMADTLPFTPQVWAGAVGTTACADAAVTTARAAITTLANADRTTAARGNICAP